MIPITPEQALRRFRAGLQVVIDRAPLPFWRNKAAEPEDRILVDREGVAYLTERPVKLKGRKTG